MRVPWVGENSNSISITESLATTDPSSSTTSTSVPSALGFMAAALRSTCKHLPTISIITTDSRIYAPKNHNQNIHIHMHRFMQEGCQNMLDLVHFLYVFSIRFAVIFNFYKNMWINNSQFYMWNRCCMVWLLKYIFSHPFLVAFLAILLQFSMKRLKCTVLFETPNHSYVFYELSYCSRVKGLSTIDGSSCSASATSSVSTLWRFINCLLNPN